MTLKKYLIIICLCISCVKTGHALETNVMISNLTGTSFTVSWVSKNECSGQLLLYDINMNLLNTLSDDRGINFSGDTHYITAKGLKSNASYFFSTLSGNQINDNEGQMYSVHTGDNLIPVGSLQPAGQVLLCNGNRYATNAIVYIQISNGLDQSAPLSTIVDNNGYWFVELVNARDQNNQGLFRVSEGNTLSIDVQGGQMGKASLELSAMDNKGGMVLNKPIILR